MKLIIIRGLPGTGKTVVSRILGKIFPDSEILNVDKYKKKLRIKGGNFRQSLDIAYKKAIKKLNSSKAQIIIIDEIINDAGFYNDLQKLIYKKRAEAHWIRLIKHIDFLMELEKSRKRKIKNTRQYFDNLKREVDLIKIPGEIKIKNDNLALTLKKILNFIV